MDETLAFYCQSGHELTLAEVLKAQSASVKTGLEIVLAEWEGHHHALQAMVEDAQKHGFLEVAEIFLRHTKTLESRIGRVRSAFAQSESGSFLAVPEDLRPAEPVD